MEGRPEPPRSCFCPCPRLAISACRCTCVSGRRSAATGTLTVVSTGQDPSVSTVLVEDGAIVFATSRRRRDPTGELFLELFQVPELDPDSVEEVERIRRQVTRVVAELFNVLVADASYVDGIHLSRWPKMSLSVGTLLLSGMRHVRDSNRILSWIGSADQVFVTTTDPFSFFNVELHVGRSLLSDSHRGPHPARGASLDVDHRPGPRYPARGGTSFCWRHRTG